ncbi:type 2 isopentenyl-diphosphate Delta-isomerase [Alkalihalophilus marmarensis]|jgi:isopentenyl-diphosphate delta-isomerase|uniref:Isopentenyl-diphosphate delta-isomerase n=1 Tax=Alkalihalophilus marmarensis DSM 21297 TaxID=1188261 RepID=U6SRZ6_9BACI|nr:type 2 isopentenyl-diphosphate Delta-isomerase [Alkalihalophilus marmarensis]ERN54162.1 isopentenyl pyrophosphate isomerase [Alkalihalophilus marmarensis DSM 21297]MCM3488417.1 type 2 isopentenyl-diphosphate Delta-isomerase [Alkalihalophilus marmarensis]
MSRAKRKLDHIEHALSTGQERTHGFEHIRFVHNSIPDAFVDEVDYSSEIGGLSLSSPIFINAMTGGGGERTKMINQQLAEVASECRIGIAVGSQMAAIRDPEERKSYEIVRQTLPNGVVFANLGSEATVDQAKRAVDMLRASALQIHLNVIQELVMPEGDRDFRHTLSRIEKIKDAIDVPLIIKEVGYGMSRETAETLASIGVQMIDVGGFGGTNFSRIENARRERKLSYFDDWGINTTSSIIEVTEAAKGISVISSGGLQSALDVVKSIALGADATGFAGYFLKILMEEGQTALIEEINFIHKDIKMLMTALGASSLSELKEIPLVIGGSTKEWCEQRGIPLDRYLKR